MSKPFTVYLAGPMSKYKDDPADPYAFRRFHFAADYLRYLGLVVLSPAETAGQVKNMPRDFYVALDHAMIEQSDALVVLPGWEESPGATAEAIFATELGLPIYKFHEAEGLGRQITVTSWSVRTVEGPNDGRWKGEIDVD